MNLISGGTGFIASHLARKMAETASPCRLLCRRFHEGAGIHEVMQGDLSDPVSLRDACAGIDTVFHCAGYAHAFSSSDPQQHWRVNAEGTRHLADAAGQSGVRMFVNLSSVKAMAEPGDDCINENYSGVPSLDYGRSKLAAEAAVLEAGERYGMRVVNLRLAMVYGSGGRGNLERMARLVQRGWFPPLPETGNRRSLIHVDDVVSAMRCVAGCPKASGQTYIVTGPDRPSGHELYDALRRVLGLPQRNWVVPATFLRLLGRAGDIFQTLTGHRLPFDGEVVARLLGSACYDGEKIQRDLAWVPKIGLDAGLREMLGVSKALV